MAPRQLIVIGLILGALVLLLGFAADAGWGHTIDVTLARTLGMRAGQTPEPLILFMQAISWIGGGTQRYIMITLLTLALWRWWGWRSGLAMGLCSLVSSTASNLLKVYFARLRPDLVPHLDFVDSPAYTSGHATSAAAVYLLFILLIPGKTHMGWKVGAALLIFLTGLSRIMLGVHWPSDVVGGWMLGSAFALAAYAIVRYCEGEPAWQADRHG